MPEKSPRHPQIIEMESRRKLKKHFLLNFIYPLQIFRSPKFYDENERKKIR